MTGEAYRLALQYVSERRARREITAATAARQRSVLIGFAVHYGARPVANLSQRDIERWLESRAGVAPGTRRYEWTTVRSWTRWLQRRRTIKRDPFADIKAPRVPRSVPRALPREDAERLRAVLPDSRARAIVALMLGLGLRLSEVCALEVGDYDPAARTMTITGKGGHTRLLPVPSDVEHAIVQYLAQRRRAAGPLIQRDDD